MRVDRQEVRKHFMSLEKAKVNPVEKVKYLFAYAAIVTTIGIVGVAATVCIVIALNV